METCLMYTYTHSLYLYYSNIFAGISVFNSLALLSWKPITTMTSAL